MRWLPRSGSTARGGAWSIFGQVVGPSVALVLTPLVIQHLGLAQYGILAIALAAVALLASMDGGVSIAAPRYFAVYFGSGKMREGSALFAVLLLLSLTWGVTLAVVSAFVGPAVAQVVHASGGVRVGDLQAIGLIGTCTALAYLRSILFSVVIGKAQYARLNLAYISGYLATAACSVVGIVADFRVTWFVAGIGAQYLVSSIVAAPSIVSVLRWQWLPSLGWRELLEFAPFSLRSQVVNLVSVFNAQFVSLLMGATLPLSTVGAANIGITIANQVRSLPIAVLTPIATNLNRAFGRVGQVAAESQFMRWQDLWVNGVASFGASALSACYFGILSWVGPEFSFSAVIAVVLVVGNMIQLLSGILTSWIAAVGKMQLEVNYSVISMASNVALMLLLIMPFGAIGVVVANTCAQMIGSVVLMMMVLRDSSITSRSSSLYISRVHWFWPAVGGGITLVVEATCGAFGFTGPVGLLVCGLLAAPGFVLSAVASRRLAIRSWRTEGT